MEWDNVRAVFFDAGYTLLCMDPPQETIFLRVCAELGIQIDATRLPAAVQRANVLLGPRTPASLPIPYSKERVDLFWIDYNRELLAGCAMQPEHVDLAEAVYRRFSEKLGWRIYDDVRPLLTSLRGRGITLGVISNWTGDLEEVLHRIDLRAPFDIILDSARFGHEKPHPEIFVEALRRAGVPAEHAMHVGDSIDLDVEGALASGLRAVLLDREDRHAHFDRAPRVTWLDAILDLMRAPV
jgi:putative hydrolase of the HAD superfamily